MLGWQMLVVLGSYAACLVPKLLDLLDRSLDEPEIECPHCGVPGNVRRNCHWERPEHRSLVCYGCMTAWFENPAPQPGSTDSRRRERRHAGAMARRRPRRRAGGPSSSGNAASAPAW